MIISFAVPHKQECEFLFGSGTGLSRKIINITKIAKEHGKQKCNAIFGLYVFTRYDSVNAIKGKGKLKALELLNRLDEYCKVFQELRMQWNLEDEILHQIETFVCSLYGRASCSSVDTARYNLFRLKCKSKEALPPNQDCLIQHLKRANYQCTIYRQCLEQFIQAPSPIGKVWKLVNNELSYEWMTEDQDSPGILNSVHCNV